MTKKENELLLTLIKDVKETTKILYQLESKVNDLRQANTISLFTDFLIQKGHTKQQAFEQARQVGLLGDAGISTTVVK
jgi:hypothetical protein